MLSVLIGAVINIVLDPVFIFVFGMGVSARRWLPSFLSRQRRVGAALLFQRKSGIRIRRGNIKFESVWLAKVIGLGTAPFIMQSTEPCEYHAERRAAARYGGDTALWAA